MTDTLIGRLRAALAESGLFDPAGLAVLAVSGGPDSVALLDIMAALAPELGLTLVVAHADHGIREDSARAARDVVDLARQRYALEGVVGELFLGSAAGETRARVARYRFLRRLQAERGARYLVTAHHADDQIETVLLRLFKGTALAGLAGIPQRGPGGLVRPLLRVSRRELRSHVETRGLRFHLDPANTDPRHIRSWLRTTLLPSIVSRLGEAGPEALLRTARFALEEVQAWDHTLDQLPGLDLKTLRGRVNVARDALRGYDNVLAGRVLRAAARRAGMRLLPGDARRVARVAHEGSSGRRLALADGLFAEVAFDRLVIGRPGEAPGALVLEGSRGEAVFGCYRISWRPEPAPGEVPRQGWTTWAPEGELAVRCPEPGDRIRPVRGVGHKRVVRVLMEARVARADRQGFPVFVRDNELIWVPGACRAGAALPEPGSSAVRIDVEPG